MFRAVPEELTRKPASSDAGYTMPVLPGDLPRMRRLPTLRVASPVAPCEPSLHGAEVELRTGDPDRDLVGAGIGDRVGQIEGRRIHANGPVDGLRVPSDLLAPGVQHRVLVPHLFGGERLPELSRANPCQMSACWAVRRKVTFSPAPPIIMGSGPIGGGLSLPSRAFMRGMAAARSRSRLGAVPNS